MSDSALAEWDADEYGNVAGRPVFARVVEAPDGD